MTLCTLHYPFQPRLSCIRNILVKFTLSAACSFKLIDENKHFTEAELLPLSLCHCSSCTIIQIAESTGPKQSYLPSYHFNIHWSLAPLQLRASWLHINFPVFQLRWACVHFMFICFCGGLSFLTHAFRSNCFDFHKINSFHVSRRLLMQGVILSCLA